MFSAVSNENKAPLTGVTLGQIYLFFNEILWCLET